MSSKIMRTRRSNPMQTSDSKIPQFQNMCYMPYDATCVTLNLYSQLACESCKCKTDMLCEASSSKKVKFRHLSDKKSL